MTMTKPKSRPITLSALNVRAVLNGTKTKERRIVKPQSAILSDAMARSFGVRPPNVENCPVIPCPYGQPGSLLWVKETWNSSNQWNVMKPTEMPEGAPIFYAADCTADDFDGLGPWRPSLFMRRWMSRITLEIVSVRVERLRDISESGAIAEGCAPAYSLAGYNVIGSDGSIVFVTDDFAGGIPKPGDNWQRMKVEHVQRMPARILSTAREEYRRLWILINGAESWNANPYVWAIEFRRVEGGRA